MLNVLRAKRNLVGSSRQSSQSDGTGIRTFFSPEICSSPDGWREMYSSMGTNGNYFHGNTLQDAKPLPLAAPLIFLVLVVS